MPTPKFPTKKEMRVKIEKNLKTIMGTISHGATQMENGLKVEYTIKNGKIHCACTITNDCGKVKNHEYIMNVLLTVV